MFNNSFGLRGKMLLIAAIALLFMFALLFVAARLVLIDGFTKLEKDKTNIQLNSAVSLIKDQSNQLGLSARDNAVWDDMYEYAAKPSLKFEVSSLSTEFYNSLKINVVFIINSLGEILYQRGYDYVNSKPLRIPDFLKQAASKNGILTNPAKEEIAGLLWTQQGIYFVTSQGIFDSNKSKPSRGKLIMARLLTTDTTSKLEKTLGTVINVEAYRSDEMDVISPLLKINQSAVIPLNNQQIVGYAKLEDLGGNTNILLKVFSDRKIYAQGKSSLKFFYWSLALIAAILAVFSWLFDQFILTRIAQLNQSILQIGASAVTSGRVKVKETAGKDELNSLAHGINGMLTQLDNAKSELQFEKERAQVTLTSIAEAVITSDINSCVLYMNTAAERLTGIDANYALGKPLNNLFHLMTADKTTNVNSGWLTNPQSIVDEVLLARADGQEFILSKSASPLHGADGGLFGTVTVLHDVTTLRMMSNQLSHQARFDALKV